ncbi:hypothetical protein D9M68_868920 [compost metagenome]
MQEVAVRRWGKMANHRKGGEVMVEKQGVSHAERLTNDKMRRGYEVDPVRLDAPNWLNDLPPQWVTEIYSCLTIEPGNTLVFDGETETAELVLATPNVKVPEPDRGADWGSW